MKTKSFREFEARTSDVLFALNQEFRNAMKRANDRNQETGKDAQYWVEIGTSDGLLKAIDIFEKALQAKYDIA